MIDFIIPLDPVAKGRPRFSRRGQAYTPDKTRRFEADVKKIARRHRPTTPMTGAIQVTLIFNMRRPKACKRAFPSVRPDIDNLSKAIMDALSDFWLDDGQIVNLSARKNYGSPSIQVSILEFC